jgi:hypothetical protein
MADPRASPWREVGADGMEAFHAPNGSMPPAIRLYKADQLRDPSLLCQCPGSLRNHPTIQALAMRAQTGTTRTGRLLELAPRLVQRRLPLVIVMSI